MTQKTLIAIYTAICIGVAVVIMLMCFGYS